jgi:hypothetical protein
MSNQQNQPPQNQPGTSSGDLPQQQLQQQHLQPQPEPHDDEVRFLFENNISLPLPDHDDHIEGVDPTYVRPNFVFRPRPGSTHIEAVAQRLKFEEEIRNWIHYEEELKRLEQERVAAVENGGPRVPINFDAPDNMPDIDREP